MIDDLKDRRMKYLNKGVRVCLIVAALTFILFLLFIFLLIQSDTNSDIGESMVPVVLFGVAWIFSLILSIIFKLHSPNGAEKAIDKFCNRTAEPSATKARLEQTWNNGMDFELGKIDDEYIISVINGKVSIIPLQNVVWAYGYIQSMLFINFNVTLFVKYNDGKTLSLNLAWFSTKHLDRILDCMLKSTSQIAIGVSDEFNKLYKSKNWSALLEHAHAQRKEVENEIKI